MFNKTHFNQLTSNIEQEDYLNLTIIGPATTQVQQQVNAMTQAEKLEAFKTYDVHYESALKSRMVATIVRARFNLYGIKFN